MDSVQRTGIDSSRLRNTRVNRHATVFNNFFRFSFLFLGMRTHLPDTYSSATPSSLPKGAARRRLPGGRGAGAGWRIAMAARVTMVHAVTRTRLSSVNQGVNQQRRRRRRRHQRRYGSEALRLIVTELTNHHHHHHHHKYFVELSKKSSSKFEKTIL